jgi:putative membrane protein
MSDDRTQKEAGDPRTYLAAERTLLAWIRTGLAMMGFGFVVARFGLFLREVEAMQGSPAPQRLAVSLWVGTTLVVLGVAANFLAAIQHWLSIRRLNRGQPLRFRSLSLGIAVALMLAVLGLLIAGYLIFGLNGPGTGEVHANFRR